MSDFGMVYDYALQLEAEMPAPGLAKLAAFRPAFFPPTKEMREKAAAEERQHAAAAASAERHAAAPAADDKRK